LSFDFLQPSYGLSIAFGCDPSRSFTRIDTCKSDWAMWNPAFLEDGPSGCGGGNLSFVHLNSIRVVLILYPVSFMIQSSVSVCPSCATSVKRSVYYFGLF
jgi:hypothetical protein